MITLTTEQAQQIEEALEDIVRVFKFETGTPVEALAVIRAARAQGRAEQDLDTCPGCGGVADNGHDREFPPNPYYCSKCIEQAEQEPVAVVKRQVGNSLVVHITGNVSAGDLLYTRPVRTKDLTNDEICKIMGWDSAWSLINAEGVARGHKKISDARAVIAADREKNRG